jgi:hypothetical protein
MQYSLRTLLLAVTAVAIFCSLTRWLHELGIAISLLVLGIGFLAAGLWRKRVGFILAGFGSIIALVFSFSLLLTEACWVGGKKVSVVVRVHDASGKPLAGARVQLTDRNHAISTASTDSTGAAIVAGEFQICGQDSVFRKTGIVELLGERLNVTAAGHKVFDRELDEFVVGACWDLYAAAPPEVCIQLESNVAQPP